MNMVRAGVVEHPETGGVYDHQDSTNCPGN